MNNENLFRQALQRQNERAAGMKMPDDMEQRVMDSLKSKATKRRWLYPLSAIAVAACVLLLILLNIEKQKPEQTPVIAEEVTVPKDNPQAVIPTEVEQPVVAQKEEPQPAKKRRKAHKTKHEEPMPQEAKPIQEEPEQENIYLPQQPDPYLLAVAETQDIRSRGEHLYQEVNQIFINAQNIER